MRVSAPVKSERPQSFQSSDEDIFSAVRGFKRVLDAVTSYEVRLSSHPQASLHLSAGLPH